jgi:DNA-binding winged helix-turn-helix (wHTH) protein/tetratricopeptide (TPR) repeat protein
MIQTGRDTRLSGPFGDHRVVRFGLFEVDLEAQELRKAGMRIKLPDQPFQILAMLLEHPGRLVTREELQHRLWPQDTFVDFELSLNAAVKKLRQALGDDAHNPRFVETVYRRGYRFVGPVSAVTPPSETAEQDASPPRNLESAVSETPTTAPAPQAAPDASRSSSVPESAAGELAAPAVPAQPARNRRRLLWTAVLVAVGLAALLLVEYFITRTPLRAAKLTDKDTVVLADFTNTTGDTVFDGTLRQGLSSQLAQSPFLNLLSDQAIAQTLALMKQPTDARLTAKLAGEVCLRTASAAIIEGSIANLGNEYVLGLKAVTCPSGDLLADEQVTANGKEQVLKELGTAATKLRRQLGESLASVQKYDVPLENVTTPSLEALQAYSIGYQVAILQSDYPAALPFFERAITLDPDFAMAYAMMGTALNNQFEFALAEENTRKAFALRERVSERERLYITSHYENFVTGDLEAARQAYGMWAQIYPRDDVPYNNLGEIYLLLGALEKAIAAFQEAVELNPGIPLMRVNLIQTYMSLNRLDEAKAAVADMQAHKLDAPELHLSLYVLYFLQHDQKGMEREAAVVMAKPGWEHRILNLEATTAAARGQLTKARELNRRAIDVAQHENRKEEAAAYKAIAAWSEILSGNVGGASRQAQQALQLSGSIEAKAICPVVLALASRSGQATRLAKDLAGSFPRNTKIRFFYLPAIRAAVALQSGDAPGAIEHLAPVVPYDLALTLYGFGLASAYLRGQAYLAEGNGTAAAGEFRKLLEHPALTPNHLLAQLQVGRAYALSGDTTQARAAYQEFFRLWANADSDVPILKRAKAEYARLH